MPITKASSSAVAPGAKGELVVGNATNDSGIVSVGANGTVLTADSAEATGVKWAAAGGGGLTLLSTTTLSGNFTTISGISTAYTNLFIVINNPHTNTGGIMQINPNGTTNVSSGARISGTSSSAVDNILSSNAVAMPTSSTPTNAYVLQIFNYSQSVNGKPYQLLGGLSNSTGSGFAIGFIQLTGAITSLEFTTSTGTPTYSGGTVLIYGVK